jgi:hypothetical protein
MTALNVRPEDFAAGKIGVAVPFRGQPMPELTIEDFEEFEQEQEEEDAEEEGKIATQEETESKEKDRLEPEEDAKEDAAEENSEEEKVEVNEEEKKLKEMLKMETAKPVPVSPPEPPTTVKIDPAPALRVDVKSAQKPTKPLLTQQDEKNSISIRTGSFLANSDNLSLIILPLAAIFVGRQIMIDREEMQKEIEAEIASAEKRKKEAANAADAATTLLAAGFLSLGFVFIRLLAPV